MCIPGLGDFSFRRHYSSKHLGNCPSQQELKSDLMTLSHVGFRMDLGKTKGSRINY